MLTHGRKASTSTSPQFWQQFASQQLKELLTAEVKVTDFSNCTKKKDLVDMCIQHKLDKRVFDRWISRFKENRTQTRAYSPPRRVVTKLKLPDPLQASRCAQQELKSNKRPSLGVDPNTIFDTSESIADEEMNSADAMNSSASPIAQTRGITHLRRGPTDSPPSREPSHRRVKRTTKRVPKLNIPSRQKALRVALTARREADTRLASLRHSPLKTRRDYEAAAAEHKLTASLQMLNQLPPRLHAPPQPSATFISDDGDESVTTDLTPLLPQKTRPKTSPSYSDELHQAKVNEARHLRDPPVKDPAPGPPKQVQDFPQRVPPVRRDISQRTPLPPQPFVEPPQRDLLRRDWTHKEPAAAKSATQTTKEAPTPIERAQALGWKPSPIPTKTPTMNSRTPAVIKRNSLANSAIRRRAMAEAKLVKGHTDDTARFDSEEQTKVSPEVPVPQSGSWLWSRVWIAGVLSMAVVWLVCGGVSGLGGWSSTAVNTGEPIEFCSSGGEVSPRKCAPCPVEAECTDGRAHCGAYFGLSGGAHRWRCVSYKELVYAIASKSLPEIARHLRNQDRKRGCQSGEEGGHYEDVWDLFDEYVAPYVNEMPESWYINPSLPGWGLDNVEDSRRSDLMTVWYSDVLSEANLAKHNIVKHGTREYALGSFSRKRLWKCRASLLVSHSFFIPLTLTTCLGLVALKRHQRAKVKMDDRSLTISVPVSMPRRQTRTNKTLH